MGYLGKIQDTAGNIHLIGSTLYGTCSTSANIGAKQITCSDFNSTGVPTGLTIRIKFTYGNALANTVLLLGSTSYTVAAPSVWNAGDIVTFTFDGTYWQISGAIDSTKLPLSGGTMTGDIQLNSNKIYFGDTSDGAYLQRDSDNTSVKFIYQAGQVEIANGGVTIKGGGGGISLIPNSSSSVDVSGTLTATTLSNTKLNGCSLSNDLDAVSNSIYFGPNSSTRGTIGYTSSALKLQYQGSSITLGSSTITMTCPAWPIGTGSKVYINGNTLSKESSSKRYKDGINYNIDKEKFHSTLMQMKPCQFHYKTEPDLNQYGFIAEDIEELDSKLCIYDNDKVENYLDRGVMALVVSELQRKDKEIEELRERIEKLENKGG